MASSTHCPQDDAGAYTRVPPVVAPQVPVNPVMVTREPVTAFIPPPGTHAVPPPVPIASVESGIQLPSNPGKILSNKMVEFGLPTPVYPELDVNKQPAVQYIEFGTLKHTAGQSAGRA